MALPEHRPKALRVDKGYDADAIRADLATRRVKVAIPGPSKPHDPDPVRPRLYKQRNRIERMIGRLKIYRALATRYDNLTECFLDMAQIAAIRLWLKYVTPPVRFGVDVRQSRSP